MIFLLYTATIHTIYIDNPTQLNSLINPARQLNNHCRNIKNNKTSLWAAPLLIPLPRNPSQKQNLDEHPRSQNPNSLERSPIPENPIPENPSSLATTNLLSRALNSKRQPQKISHSRTKATMPQHIQYELYPHIRKNTDTAVLCKRERPQGPHHKKALHETPQQQP